MFSKDLGEKLDKFHLLKHPFYQIYWNEGKLNREIIKDYAEQYYQHVKAFPRYISATHSICYGYLIMGIVQYSLVLFLSFEYLTFDKLYYVLIAVVIYFPIQKVFKRINDNKFSKYINVIALIYGLIIIFSYFN